MIVLLLRLAALVGFFCALATGMPALILTAAGLGIVFFCIG